VLALVNHPARTEYYDLSLPDALPICVQRVNAQETVMVDNGKTDKDMTANQSPAAEAPVTEAASKEVEEVSSPKVGGAESEAEGRSEEHTSELQSRENLVCRLLLEKKK